MTTAQIDSSTVPAVFRATGVAPSIQQQDTTVDEMKVKTMYKMIEDIDVRIQGQNVVKKVLYLTNKQAALFDDAAMERCIQELDVGEPKFIIRLNPSTGVASQNQIAHEELEGTPSAEFQSNNLLHGPWARNWETAHMSSELDKLDDRVVETQIILFMKTCILPLAHRTRATIVISGANECYLATALAVVAVEEQARLGAACPFNVIAIGWQGDVNSRAVTPEDSRSLAAQILKGSTRWKDRLAIIEPAMAAFSKALDGQVFRCDLTEAASHYILFEGIDEDSNELNIGPMMKFDSMFMTFLTKKVPSIVIQSHKIIMTVQSLSDYALRKIPILLLDSTERAVTLKAVSPDFEPKTLLAKKSNAFPAVSAARLRKIKLDSNGSIDLAGRKELLDICCAMIEDKWAALTAAGVVDALDTSLLAFLHSALHFRTKRRDGSSSDVPLFARIRDLEMLQQANKESSNDAVPLELASKAVTFIQTRDLALKRIAQLNRVELWLQRNQDSHSLWQDAVKCRDALSVLCEEIHSSGGLAKESVAMGEWLAYFNVLTSPVVFSGSIHDIEQLKQTLISAAKLDRLPPDNSLEALRIIADAWDHVEAYNHMADAYKRATKISYQLLLIAGIFITVAVIVESAEQSTLHFQSRVYIICLSFFTSAVAAYVAFVNPAVRWQQLRAAAVTIESNVWMFRTRTGNYRASSPGDYDDNIAEGQLQQTVQDVKVGVLDGADIKNSAFFGRSKTFNEHQQHEVGEAGFGVQDSYLATINGPQLSGMSAYLWNCVCGRNPAAAIAPSEPNAPSVSALKGSQDLENNKSAGSDVCASLAQHLEKINSSQLGDGTENLDNHYDPLKPTNYIKYRALPILNFYKNRIPRCHTMRNATQILLVLSGMATGILAIVDLSVWAAIVSAVAAAVCFIHTYIFTSQLPIPI